MPSRSTPSWTTPQPADVLCYLYLWRHEQVDGREDGAKVRPVLVMSAQQTEAGLVVLVAPITTRDYAPAQSIIMPLRVCDHLRLDNRSKIVTTEVNRFIWVGPDVVPGRDGSPFIGTAPAALHDLVRKKMIAGRLRIVDRTV